MAWTRNRPLGLVHRDPQQSEDGYTLFCPVRGRHASLLDPEGRIVHRWFHPEGIQHAVLTERGSLLVHTQPPKDAGGCEQIGGSAAALLELDWDSEVLWEYRDDRMHHDYVRLPSGNLLLLLWDQVADGVTERVRGGFSHREDPEVMWGDIVREITPSGETVREWRSWEHLDPELDVLCPLESRKEWTHANSIALTPEGDWLLSFRLTSTVAIVDQRSGALRWRWGSRILSHQHAATWLDTGKVMIFDNGCHRRRMPSFSQVLEVDPETDAITWSYFGTPVLAFFSFMVGGADRLPGGNTLITEGATGRLFEVTPRGETVWEYVSPFTGIDLRFGPTPAVFRAHRDPIDDPRLAGRALDPAEHEALNRRAAAGGLGVEDA